MISAGAWYDGFMTTWPLTRIKYGFSRISSGTTPPSEKTEYYGGGIPWVTTSELRENRITETVQTLTEAALEDFSTLKLYDPDTILFAMYGATIGRVATLGISATVNQAVCALSQPTRFVPRFVVYALQASRDYLVSVASGGGQPNLNAAKLRDHTLPSPSLPVQHRIADYLDAETAEIDALIAEKERMLALLEEQRAAVVTLAVTRGLDPNVPLKPSCLEWLGDIPQHWSVMQLKRTWSSAEYGISESIRDEGDVRVLRMSCIMKDGLVDLENAGQIEEVPESMLRAAIFSPA